MMAFGPGLCALFPLGREWDFLSLTRITPLLRFCVFCSFRKHMRHFLRSSSSRVIFSDNCTSSLVRHAASSSNHVKRMRSKRRVEGRERLNFWGITVLTKIMTTLPLTPPPHRIASRLEGNPVILCVRRFIDQ